MIHTVHLCRCTPIWFLIANLNFINNWNIQSYFIYTCFSYLCGLYIEKYKKKINEVNVNRFCDKLNANILYINMLIEPRTDNKLLREMFKKRVDAF